jgi:hypothetical protein
MPWSKKEGKLWENNMLLSLRRMLGMEKTRQDLIRQEIRAASDIFPQDPGGRKFDFFYYGRVDKDTYEWIFHDWFKTGKDWQVTTTRYLIKPNGIYRARSNQPYRLVPREEARRLAEAAAVYYNKIKSAVYS